MARRVQKVFYIEHSDLREKYHTQPKERITSLCKAIGQYTQSQINVQVMPRGGSVRFEVVGNRTAKTKEHILRELCQPKSFAKHNVKGVVPVTHSSQRAQQIMSEANQDKILKDGIEQHYLLTEDALGKHNLLTGASELREFACGPCDRFWWKVVLITKAVSRCYSCKVKYDCLPRDKEFGIGRYMCQNETCNQRMFYQRCHATQAVNCRNCNCLVYKPYIHPKFRRSKQNRKPLDPNAKPFKPPLPLNPPPLLVVPFPLHLYGHPFPYPPATLPPADRVPITTVKKKRVINPSTPHDSTGSTVDTFLTQSVVSDLDVQLAEPDSDSDEEIILPSSDSDSSSDDDTAPTQSEDDSASEIASDAPMFPSDSSSDSDDDLPRHHKREVCSDSSSSSGSQSGSDTDDDEPPPSEASSGKLSSQASSALDSGVGTASSAETRSSIDSAKPLSTDSQVSSGKFNSLRITEFKTEYPGILFSKKCSQKSIDHHDNILLAEGIKVIIPPKAVVSGDSVPVTVQACLKGPFKLSRAYVPISPVYLLYPPCVFHEKVTLKFNVFADIEDADEIVFVTSGDKPRIVKEQAVWKFRKDSTATVEVSPGSREVTVKVGHFCLGLLARLRRRRDERNFYILCLYKPSVLLPTCHAIFAAFLDHQVYKNSLETYLDKKYAGEQFEESVQHVRLSEDKIQLVVSDNTTNTNITPDKTPCVIKKAVIDLPLKHKRYKEGNVSTYPPRIVWTIQCDPDSFHSLRPLMCTVDVSGTEDEIRFPVSIPPSRSPSLSSSRSVSSEGSNQSSQSIIYNALIKQAGLHQHPQLLDLQCTKDHRNKISRLVPNWLVLAEGLKLRKQDILAIKSDPHLDNPDMKAQKVLDTWHRYNIFMATYKKLIEVCVEQRDTELAQKICSIVTELKETVAV